MKHNILKFAVWLFVGIYGFSLTVTAFAQDSAETISEDTSAETNEASEDEYTEEEIAAIKAYQEEAAAFFEKLDPKTGLIVLDLIGAKLDLGENYYYLNKADSKKVLEDLWGNPPNDETLGMIFEKDTDPYFNAYAVVLTFDRSGYVSDEDAKDIKFDKLLKQMQKEAKSTNQARVEQGYQTIEILGWAAPPNYDADKKRVSWAKSIQFGGDDVETLNYNMRFLSRRGVLEFNYISSMEYLDDVTTAMPSMMNIASFNEGHRYEDFNETTDKVAAYGVAGLIAGGVAAKKLGLLGVLLLFLKKGWIVIVAVLALGQRFIRSMFNRENS